MIDSVTSKCNGCGTETEAAPSDGKCENCGSDDVDIRVQGHAKMSQEAMANFLGGDNIYIGSDSGPHILGKSLGNGKVWVEPE